MAHVQIHQEKLGDPISVVIDGVEMNTHILVEDFRVKFPGDLDLPVAVHMVIAADSLDLDLPDAVLEAVARDTDEVA
jgi:hypothetical protein